MGKSYKKKTNRKKPTCGGKKKKFSRRKMKGGVAFNTSFSSSSLPSSTYIPLNQNVNANPSWDQISSRLLPEMKGGKGTRKKRGVDTKGLYRKFRSKKGGADSNQTIDTPEEYVKYAINKGFIDQLDRALQSNPELATPELLKYAETNSDEDNKEDIINIINGNMNQNGGKKKKRKTKRRKMKGGSLIGTDVVTGLNTTGTNSALAFGTSGGTNYMLDTLTAKEINSGDHMSPDLRTIPLV